MALDQTADPVDEFEQLNKLARDWGRMTRDQLLRKLLSLGLHNRRKLAKQVSRVNYRKGVTKTTVVKEPFLTASLGYSIKRFRGEVDYIGFRFARHGIFLEHGVGRGRPVGSAKAEANRKIWLQAILPDRIEELADQLADYYGDTAVNQLRFLIPGIIDINVSR